MTNLASRRVGARDTTGVDAGVDEVSAGGYLTGWARHAGPEPAIVRIRLKRELLAEARAALFRADLLRRGMAHGHYGFRARVRRALPPGRYAVRLLVADEGPGLPVRLDIPEMPPPSPAAVESLLSEPPGWTLRDVLSAPQCLALELDMQAMGARRFVDMMFHFALRRWPATHEGSFYASLLQSATLTPQALLAELLTSRERADLDPAMLSPWHPEFPFPAAARGDTA